MYENVELPLTYRGMTAAERKERVKAALEKVGHGPSREALSRQLSGGQQQRVAVARAVAGAPSILSPTSQPETSTRRTAKPSWTAPRAASRRRDDLHGHARPALRPPRRSQIHLFDGRIVDEDGSKRAEKELEESGFDMAH